MSVILAVIEARSSSRGGSGSHIHLSPADFNAIWHLTQWLGRQFWHLTAWAQVALIAVPAVPAFAWMQRWDPLAPEKGRKTDA